jgi:hypothetical protein
MKTLMMIICLMLSAQVTWASEADYYRILDESIAQEKASQQAREQTDQQIQAMRDDAESQLFALQQEIDELKIQQKYRSN